METLGISRILEIAAEAEGGVFRTILDAIGDGVIAVDAAGRPLYRNATAEALIGTDPFPADPRDWPAHCGVFLPDAKTPFPGTALPLARALRGEASDGVELFIRNARRPEGVHLSVTARPLRAPGGTLAGAVVVLRDIGAHRRAEDELKKVNAFLDSIVENIPAMIFVKEAENLRFELFNRAGEELLGFQRPDLIGKSDFDFFPKDQAEFFQARDREALARPSGIDIPEEPIRTARGERWLHTKKIPILDERGTARYLLGISLDITARKEAEEALRRAKEELEARVAERTEALLRSEEQLRHAQKMEAVGRLAGGIAHDFNNLLLVMAGFSERILRRAPEGDPHRQSAQMIAKAAERAAALTKQLLAFSRKQVVQPVVIDLGAAVADMDSMLRRLLGEDVELRIFAGAAPGRVLADRGQIDQVVMNLAVNARDAMPRGGKLTIETAAIELDGAWAREGLPAGRYVMLAVSDTGCGMDAETRARVFEPFFTTKERGKGTGLGLSTVYGIVKQAGGHVTAYSEPGRGATFKVYLPHVDEAAAPAARAEPAAPAPRGGETILLVEDDELVRGLVRSMLEEQGYTVLAAADGEGAASAAKEHLGPIHLLVTDVIMPRAGGRELAERLAALRPEMRVIYMSAYTDDAIVHHGVLDAGMAYLQKPFTAEALAWKVREVLDRR